MDVYTKEVADATADYLDTLVKIADKYKLKREKFVRESVLLMVCASEAVNFDEYKNEGE